MKSLLKKACAFFALAVSVCANSQTQFRYWFDYPKTMESVIYGENSGESFHLEIDASALSPDIHLFNLQIKDNEGLWGEHEHSMFVKIDPALSPTAKAAELYVDGILFKNFNDISAFGTIEIDVSSLPPGMHTIGAIITDNNNQRYPSGESLFVKTNNEQPVAKTTQINIDGETWLSRDIAAGNDMLTLDVADLPVGLHYIEAVEIDSEGYAYPSSGALFFKPSFEDLGINKYRYWLNRDDSSATEVVVDPSVDLLQLITMVEVPQMPFSTHSFTCIPSSDGGLDLYALNTVHWLFYSGNSINTSYEERSFTDTRTHVKIHNEEIEQLKNTIESEITISGINDNSGKWLYIDAEVGTIFTWRTNCACEIDLFDTTGKRLVDIDGANSIVDSTYVFNDPGRYYIGIHDPARNVSELELHYSLLNRFDVVDCEPYSSVNNGTFFADIKGNSLEDALSISISTENKVFNATAIHRFNTNSARVRFELGTEAPIGLYELNAVFKDPDNGSEKTVTLSKAVSIEEIRRSYVTVELSAVPKVENPYHFSLIINNTGNETLWGVPFNLAFEYSEAIDSITTENFALVIDSEMCNAGAKTTYFTENLLGTGNPGTFVPMLIDVLPPGIHEYKFSMAGHASTSLRFYAWTGVPWSRNDEWQPSDDNLMTWKQLCADMDVSEDKADSMLLEMREWLFSHYLGENYMPVITNISQEHPQQDHTADTGSKSSLTLHKIRYKMADSKDNNKSDNADKSNRDGEKKGSKPAGKTPSGNSGGNDGNDSSGNSGNGSNDDGHKDWNITLSISFDPNDILGYISPSGTKDVGIDAGPLSYVIEFENDPTFANAPASTIRLHSRLNPEIFDLSTFTPKMVRIGRLKAIWYSASSTVQTFDMRPAIDAIAQVAIDFNNSTGELDIIINSLDPMTMEPTNLVSQGVLPVNNDGEEGIGEFVYSVALNNTIATNTAVENSAEITFDFNESIQTPIWRNTTDFERPNSFVNSIEVDRSSETARIIVAASDEGSGIWEYELYCRHSPKDTWKHIGVINNDGVFNIPVTAGARYQLCSIVRDYAGNIENKTLKPEIEINDYEVIVIPSSGLESAIQDEVPEESQLYDFIGRKVQNPLPGIYLRKGCKVIIQ